MASVCLSSIATAQDQASKTAPFTPVLTTPAAGTGSYLSFGDQIGTAIDVSTPTGDKGIRGVSPAYGSFYVTGEGLLGTPVGVIYQFTPAGVLLGTFPQNQNATVISTFGHHDLASDGEGRNFGSPPLGGRLWGGQEGSHWVRYTLNASGGLNAGTVLPVVPGVGNIRSITLLPGSSPERFVIAGTSTTFFEIDESGALLGTFAGPAALRWWGLATNFNNPNIVFGATNNSIVTCVAGNPGSAHQVRVVALDRTAVPGSYTHTGAEFCGGAPNGNAGGLGLFDGSSEGINGGFFTFAAIHQATPVDAISLYDSGEVAGTPTVKFCTAKTLLVCGPAPLTTVGTSSATASSGFTLSFGPTRGCRSGLILYSNQPIVPGVPFGGPGDGKLCLTGQGLRRAAPIDSGGSGPAFCDGNMSMDFNAFSHAAHMAGGCTSPAGQTNPAAFLLNMGSTVRAQGWGRDSTTTGQVLSDGRQWVVGP